MNCPVCDARLRPIEKHNVEIDICPDCKGVWLDRGELDKIIEAVSTGAAPIGDSRPRVDDRREVRQDDRDRKTEIDPRTGKPKRREGWFSEIFDSFGD
jgi:Zn-finger nucleic acid-binding protein